VYGWRRRIALMVPYDNTVIEPEFGRTLPWGVSAHVIRSTSTDRKELAEESLRLAPSIRHLGAQVALYACNASSFMQGRAWHDDFLSRFEAAAGIPSESATSVVVKLIAHRRLQNVVLVTPYPEWLLDPLRRFFSDSGIGVAHVVGLGLEPPEINRLGPEGSYRAAIAADRAEADGLFILATNFRTLEILPLLEAELGKPVMSTNQALMWAAKRRLGLPERDMSEQRDPPAAWPAVAG
jgi:maleate cis-trans isomerase